MSLLLSLFLIITLSFCFSVLVVFLYSRLANRLTILTSDTSVGVKREKVPTSGGISFGFLYCLIYIFINQYFPIHDSYTYSVLIGCTLMILTGFIDDVYGLNSYLRLAVQFFFILLVSYIFNIFDLINESQIYINLFFFLLFLLACVWIINTFNFIDGADGLLSLNCAIFCLVLGTYCFLSFEINMAIYLWVLGAINLGFLVFNWAPAKLFMGDSGSLFLGSIFIIFMIGSVLNNQISMWIWLILLSLFYVETTVTLLVRIWKKDKILSEKHVLHAYQRLVLKTGDHSKPAKISLFIQIIWIIPLSYLCFIFPDMGMYLTFLAILPLALLFFYFGPYQLK